ncbi:tetratricopeptide repeat protein [Sphingomonas sp. AP4-R1]|uniref:tetratricopeptide repeat-containing sulfotransferase family protein n=1 Tax=Sphingomonas sp. AP4-R1 TaxID=2735134 RepID=UPI00149338A0|nr:sulfotransferase [Sphingomonas sp. AP4-R1]QJU59658.1 tetratricopeptide repeat protein [Sphingomonas sp. AP4-R1]
MSNRINKSSRAAKAKQSAVSRGRVEQALAAGDIAGAASLAEAALAAGQMDPMFLNLAAWRNEEIGNFPEAYRLLQRALVISPGDITILGGIAAVLRKDDRPNEAIEVIDDVVAKAPGYAAAWLERGYILDALRDEEAAAESYGRAAALDPGMAPALGKLADRAAKRGETDAAQAYARRAFATHPLEPAATFAIATMAIEARDGAAAERRLRALLDHPLDGDDRTRALTLLGDALDKQDRTAEAFAAWEAAQRNFADRYRARLGPVDGRPSHRAFIDRIAAQVAATTAPPRRYPDTDLPQAAAAHVFLLGYPRSGTTLVENVLASAPGVAALEERPTLVDTDEIVLANDGSMPDLDTLGPAFVDRLRAGYWRRVTDMAGDVTGKTFVDMNPFNGFKLPMIARLFPDARIVVMRRDPRDIALSCFRINFTPSTATYSFSDLAETARHYDALTGLVELCRERFPLAFHDLRYDRLVSDFEPTVRALAAFVGIKWTDDFMTFDRTAQSRGVRTASATQVRRGLFDGRGQWRRYEAQLAPALPILEPWVKRFGFEG